MNGVFVAAIEAQQFLQEKAWPFCIIGGLALVRWGQPRATGDVDISLLTGFGTEDEYLVALLKRFESRIDDPLRFALANRVALLKASNGIGIDVALAGLPFEERLIDRSSPFDYGKGVTLVTAAAEDLVILKAFAARPQDWIDVEGIFIRQGDRLDWPLIVDELTPLCELKEAPETIERLEALWQNAKRP